MKERFFTEEPIFDPSLEGSRGQRSLVFGREVIIAADGHHEIVEPKPKAVEPIELYYARDGGHLRGDRSHGEPTDPIQESLRRVGEA